MNKCCRAQCKCHITHCLHVKLPDVITSRIYDSNSCNVCLELDNNDKYSNNLVTAIHTIYDAANHGVVLATTDNITTIVCRLPGDERENDGTYMEFVGRCDGRLNIILRGFFIANI